MTTEWRDFFVRAAVERHGRGAPIDDGAPVPSAIDRRLRDLELEAVKLRGELARQSIAISQGERLLRRCADLLRGTEGRLDELGERHAGLASAFRDVGIMLADGVTPKEDELN